MTESIQQNLDITLIHRCLSNVISIFSEEIDAHAVYLPYFEKFSELKPSYDHFGEQLKSLLERFEAISFDFDNWDKSVLLSIQTCSEEMHNLLVALHGFYDTFSTDVEYRISKSLSGGKNAI